MNIDSLMGFRLDSALLAELNSGRYGELGVARPYYVGGDNVLTIALLVCFVLIILTLSMNRSALLARAKEFFLPKTEEDSLGPSSTSLFLHILAAVNCLLLAIMVFVCVHLHLPESDSWADKYIVILLLTGAFAVYFLLKRMLYSFVNTVFFGSKKCLQWDRAFLFLIALQTLLVYPVVLLLVYFGLSVEKGIYCLLAVLFLNKLLTIYKGWNIFFRQNRSYLQFFLYFCALEMTPLLAFCGGGFILFNTVTVKI